MVKNKKLFCATFLSLILGLGGLSAQQFAGSPGAGGDATVTHRGMTGDYPWYIDGGVVYGFEVEEFGLQVGGGYEIKQYPGLRVGGNFTYFFVDDGAFSGANVDTDFYTISGFAQYVFWEEDLFRVYGTGGITYSRFSADVSIPGFPRSSFSDSDLGLLLGVGVEYELMPRNALYSDLVYNTGDYDQFVLSLGYRYFF